MILTIDEIVDTDIDLLWFCAWISSSSSLFECLNDLQLKYKGNFYINQTFSQGFFPIR